MTSEGTRTREKVYIIGHKNHLLGYRLYGTEESGAGEKACRRNFRSGESFAGRDAGPDPGIYRLPGRDRQ